MAESGGRRSRSGGQQSGGEQRRRSSSIRKSGLKSWQNGGVEARPTATDVWDCGSGEGMPGSGNQGGEAFADDGAGGAVDRSTGG
jgi:hypothetical protein